MVGAGVVRLKQELRLRVGDLPLRVGAPLLQVGALPPRAGGVKRKLAVVLQNFEHVCGRSEYRELRTLPCS